MEGKLISIIVPIHNEALNIPLLYKSLVKNTEKLHYQFEFVFVDDGSTDKSLDDLQELAGKDERVRVLEFARNFGKEAAVSAGLDAAWGEAAIILDADLQHPPALIPKFIAAWEQGNDVVIGVRRYSKQEGRLKRLTSDWFYHLLHMVANTQITPHASDFRLLDKKVIRIFRQLTERDRITRGLIDWLGFRREYIQFTAPPRANGVASYSWRKLVDLAINTFTGYSLFPLKLAGYVGMLILITAIPIGAFLSFERFVLNDPWNWNITGTALLAMMILVLVGIMLGCLGLIALYIARIHAEVTNRPLYVVRRHAVSRRRWQQQRTQHAREFGTHEEEHAPYGEVVLQ
ncbi:MAG TPA: glycosyltransferase family 2 protein [Candidatus Saccharimonadales bacterium]|nr:glycosyltransferase family 2 protein [Candidatus Saccharimonadales bacterium]